MRAHDVSGKGKSQTLKIRVCFALTMFAPILGMVAQSPARPAGELAWAIRNDPRTLDPAKVEDSGSELLRYLTAGVLVRFNRFSMQAEPALAQSWTISPDGRSIVFHLRPGLRFSDGSPLTSADAAWSIRRVLNPATAAPVADEFLTAAEVRVETPDPLTVRVLLPRRLVGLQNIFDEIAIEPANRPSLSHVTAGPFVVGDSQPGQYLKLLRNPNYWRHDPTGAQMPYAPSIRLEVLSNRETETTRFLRGDYDFIDALPPDYFSLLNSRRPGVVHDLGASLNTEQLWFNQSSTAPLPDFERAWFSNTQFRLAVSEAIHRADLARIAYDGHATPARSFISPANQSWYNKGLKTPPENTQEALDLLARAGFHRNGQTLVDSGGHPVRFSILTNAGNASRAKMAAMIQQDLSALGMQVTLVTLDFPALIERLHHSGNYEACLLGHPNIDPDPNALLNEWLSSSPDHQWNPSQKTPATPWEAEIDRNMQLQATSPDPRVRHAAVDRVQQIVADQQPYIYLVHPDPLVAVSPALRGVQPSILQPALVWNIESIRRDGGSR